MDSKFFLEHELDIGYNLCYSPDCGCCFRSECLADKGEIMLLKDVRINLPGKGLLRIKSGFRFDGASIPRLLWSTTYHPFHHRVIVAALVHDALYASEMWERAEADNIFLLLLQKWGVPYYDRYKMYWAVRAFGGSVWKEHTPESVAFAQKSISFIAEVA